MKYADYIGKEIKYEANGVVLTGIITGADAHIGFTIQEKGTNIYLVCINGPGSPIFERFKGAMRQWKEGKRYIRKALKKGIYRPKYKYGRNPSTATCPFSQ
jgi:hypothetical protein